MMKEKLAKGLLTAIVIVVPVTVSAGELRIPVGAQAETITETKEVTTVTPAPNGISPNGAGGGNTTTNTKTTTKKSDPKKEGDLAGLGFGVALGGVFRSQTDIISTAVQNNTLRVSDGDKSSLGFWLETHYFFGIDPWLEANKYNTGRKVKVKDPVTKKESEQDVTAKIYRYGVGPFVAAQASDDNKVIKSLGIGLMFGARRERDSTNSFNIGIGYAATKINVLTDGLVINQPLPNGITEATTKSKIVGAPFLITSFSF